ncbi:MAG: hypothetical protein PHS60_15195 [Zavarzinia sp.]|nr:hypothetical protein [Zavarzinia sp.]
MSARDTLMAMVRSSRTLRWLIWAWRITLAWPALRAMWTAGGHLVDGHYGYAVLWLIAAVVLAAIGLLIGLTVLRDEQQQADRRMYVIDCETGNVTRLPRSRRK